MSKEVEFRLRTDLAPIENTPIEANFDEMKAALTDMMAPYASMVVTLETIATAKTDRARIRKVASRIDETRKAVKRVYTAPLSEFEAKCKELTVICDTAAQNLDAQVKEYDEQRVTAKLGELHEFFDAQVGEAAGYITWDDVQNPRWKNVTFSADDAKTEIVKKIEDCESGIDAIRALHSEFEAALLDEFRNSHDLASTLKKNERLTAVREMERRRKERQEREARERAQAAAAQYEETPVIDPYEAIGSAAAMPKEEPETTIVFSVTATASQFAALRTFLKSNGIKYGRA